jgi:glycosyltransferase involved in cell wall biosynthesis
MNLSQPVHEQKTDAAAPAGSPPRICLLVSSFYPVIGGGETHARLLCNEFRRRGVSVFVLTRRRLKVSPALEMVDGTPVHRVPPQGVPRFGKYLMMWPAFVHLVRTRKDYDLIYVCGLRVLGIVGIAAALLLGKRCVLRAESCGELSGGFIWESLDGRSNRIRKALFGGIIRIRNHFLKKADCFLSISGVIREEYEACGIPPAQIASITNGIDTGLFSPAAPG